MATPGKRKTKRRFAPYKSCGKTDLDIASRKLSARILNRIKKMTNTSNGSDVTEFKMEGEDKQDTSMESSQPVATGSDVCIAPIHSETSVEAGFTPASVSEASTQGLGDSTPTVWASSAHAKLDDAASQEVEGILQESEEPCCKHNMSLPSVPEVGPSRYKTAPVKEHRFVGCAEDTWSEAEKGERSKRITESKLWKNICKDQWPIVYSPTYNISFLKLENLHVFDSKKWGRIYQNLKDSESIGLSDSQIVEPSNAEEEDLRVVHSARYIKTLKSSSTVANITEIPPLAFIPNFLVQRQVLKPLRWQTGGSVLAAKLAMERGWAINLGGGFHHCCAEMGGGFCAFADITISLKFLFEKRPDVTRAMIVDLDAHQGNGHERDFYNDDRVYIMDVYNTDIYPRDSYAEEAIKKKIPVHCGIEDDEYLKLVETNLHDALNEFTPQIIIYNAGTDILMGDPLGKMAVSADGVRKRDELVFRQAKDRGIPIAMVTSGGYQKCTADVVSDSIINLHKEKLIDGPVGTVAERGFDFYNPMGYCTVL